MAFSEEVYKFRRIVLVRLERATSGNPAWDAPDIDDRGWQPDPASSSYVAADVHGPTVGLPQDAEIRVKLVRVRLDAAAALYVVSRDTSTATIMNPASRTPLAADGEITIKGGTGRWVDKFAVVGVHYGSETGPLIFEFGVRVFRVKRLDIKPYRVIVRGRTGPGTSLTAVPPTTTAAQIASLRRVANRIWRPAGIWFGLDPVTTFTITLDVAGEINYNSGTSGGANNTVNGTAIASGDHGEFWQIRNTASGGQHTARKINVYWVHQFTDVDVAPANQHNLRAMTWDKRLDAATHGIVMKDGADGNDLAHELGHFLSLFTRRLLHADQDRGTRHSLHDVQVLQRLMYSFNPYVSRRSYRRNIGYGANQRGALLTMRNKSQYNRDAEWYEARRRARSPF